VDGKLCPLLCEQRIGKNREEEQKRKAEYSIFLANFMPQMSLCDSNCLWWEWLVCFHEKNVHHQASSEIAQHPGEGAGGMGSVLFSLMAVPVISVGVGDMNDTDTG